MGVAPEELRAPGVIDLRGSVPRPAAGHPAPTIAGASRRTLGSAAPWRLLTTVGLLVDAAAVLGAYALADRVQRGALGAGPAAPLLHAGPVLGSTVVVWLAVFAVYGLYDQRRLVSAVDEARRIFHGVSVSVVTFVLVTFALHSDLSRGFIGSVWLTSLALVGGGRLLVRWGARALASRGVLTARTVVVGTNSEARTITRTLERLPRLGYRVAGFVATGEGSFDTVDGLPVLGDLGDLARVVAETRAENVMVAGTAVGAEALPGLYRLLQSLDVDVRVSAGLPEVAASRVVVEPLDRLAVLSLRRNQLSGAQTAIKRAFDIVGSTALLVLSAPLLLAIAAVVRVSSGPGVIFSQVRVGEGGRPFTIHKFRTMVRPFTIHKFRTMVRDAEARLADLWDLNEADGGDMMFKLARDPRVTKVGRFLRRFGLDELPQLWNVLRGEMSLVGPRPPLPHEAERYDEWVGGRLKVKPGLTGLWQVNGRHELSFDDYVRYDLFYIENWSLTLDLYVILRTFPALLSRRGAS